MNLTNRTVSRDRSGLSAMVVLSCSEVSARGSVMRLARWRSDTTGLLHLDPGCTLRGRLFVVPRHQVQSHQESRQSKEHDGNRVEKASRVFRIRSRSKVHPEADLVERHGREIEPARSAHLG